MSGATAKTVLVIDDDPFLRAFAAAVLEDAGFKIEQADTAMKGIAAATRTRPDLIVLDYAMPVHDGFDVLRGLAAIEGLGATPVIVLSAWQSEGVRKQVHALGAAWLDKPVSAQALVSAVRRKLPH